ncbi:methylmalonyl Co-A mutase-associated GTPase MeaB [Deinococcus peraridilitoris]|uniref:LAO/AO transport system ATPase n=1 Tax=Deinococcus peraridilitoris (strain DSM 19664 / LMG 22246 / CIP 109416 / KR-200) TaxID=937777 RepID=L0A5I8_DEIPD|nr:methylmalonyl Co-A mutase-associated GTPase MeaB [Deinococcus peraridilitoris]AFZ68699.1 LAO/AO transport system ATPase [Deinococcus peraridilitoris DSM 19664]
MTLSSSLLERFRAGDPRALARLITLVESETPLGAELLSALRSGTPSAPVIGVTGSPGSGKSTLVDALIASARERGERVGVVAVDPSSPFSGGAILGDRIRMLRHHADTGVFVRSLASRGALGGLSKRAMGVVSLMEAFDFDWIFLETVGVGQSEVDIASVADHTLLVLTPAGGDAVQAFKAGIMEIADLLIVNKADLPGAERMVRELRAALGLGAHDEFTWLPPILKTVASSGDGARDVLDAVLKHRVFLGEAGLAERRLERARFEVRAEVQERASRLAGRAESDVLRAVAAGKLSAGEAADHLLRGS